MSDEVNPMHTFGKVSKVFDNLINETVSAIIDEGKGFNSFPRTRDQIIYDRAGVFVESMMVKDLFTLLLSVKPIDSDLDNGLSDKSKELQHTLMQLKWDIQDVVTELVNQRL